MKCFFMGGAARRSLGSPPVFEVFEVFARGAKLYGNGLPSVVFEVFEVSEVSEVSEVFEVSEVSEVSEVFEVF